MTDTTQTLSAPDLLDEAIGSWEYARHGVLAEAEGIPDDSWNFRPHERARSVSELVTHILRYGLMMAGELTNPQGDFTRQAPQAFVDEYSSQLPEDPTPPELKDLLSSTLEDGVARFRAAGEPAMLRPIRRFDGELWTRLTWMYHGIGHEEYHRGQIAIYARTMGLVPALTRAIHGKRAK
jgi:uncharacterized damage-inducible protein DinB